MILLSVLVCLIAATVSEYIMHRWFMHRRGSLWYHSHHVEHHGHGENEDHHMGFTLVQLLQAWLLAAPITISCCYYLTPWHLVFWTICKPGGSWCGGPFIAESTTNPATGGFAASCHGTPTASGITWGIMRKQLRTMAPCFPGPTTCSEPCIARKVEGRRSPS
jgi:hypothetical protein